MIWLRGRWIPLTVLVAATTVLVVTLAWTASSAPGVAGGQDGQPPPSAMVLYFLTSTYSIAPGRSCS
ncbi:hypothetical protein [Micromonospora cremea]|uniref:hypothetical protein n=1 Tax=Micromonospora cremea TaxID=709881 RepID=UPI0011810DFC|nr:hypothetical protein [Micromonospora cremea]